MKNIEKTKNLGGGGKKTEKNGDIGWTLENYVL